MSTTWSSLLNAVRAELGDNGAKQRWSDSVLYTWTCDGVRDYSLTLPLRKSASLTDMVGSGYTLPTDYIDALFVESPLGTTLTKRLMAPGYRYQSRTDYPTQYWVDGTELYMNGSAPDDEDPLLYYYAVHTTPSDVDDEAFTFSVPDRDIELIRLYVKSRALQQIRTSTAMLDRFKVGSGPRTDNPIAPEVDSFMDEYERKLASRIPGGVIRLWRMTS